LLVGGQERTLEFLTELTRDPSPFARRLASEGTRPRLPMAGRLPQFQADPTPVIALLDRLFTDPNLMVRRSVANNVNDIAKDNPDLAVATLARWCGLDDGPETAWLIRHGLRTLIKADHPGALALLGFDPPSLTVLSAAWEPKALALGDAGTFTVRVRSTARTPQRLALNYAIGFVKANGSRTPKVFRLPDKVIDPDETLTVTKTHTFRPYRNQRFHSGVHRLEVKANGSLLFAADFELVVPVG
jgi:3-methyladenine DNA glycosylase AlkC